MAACVCLLVLTAACAGGRSGSLSGRVYEPGQTFEDRTVALLGVGLFLSEPFLAPGLVDPEARLLQAAGSWVEAVNLDLSASLMSPSAGRILKTAFSQVGLPYKFGGTSPQTGFDCSGFVGWVYGQNGIKLPRSSPEMIGQGEAVARHKLVPGDLVFFGRKQRVTHVGIYTGDNRYIHSPSRGKGIQESSLDDRSRGEYYVGARRLLSGLELAQAMGTPGLTEPSAFPGAEAAAEELETDRLLPDLRESAEVLASAALARAETTPRLETAPAAGGNKPAVADKPQASSPVTSHQAKPLASKPPGTHRVRAGDTIFDLARKYGLSQAELARANNLDKKGQTLIRPGQVLVVPAKK